MRDERKTQDRSGENNDGRVTRETPDRRGELAAELGRRGRPHERGFFPGAWPRVASLRHCPGPRCFGLAPSPASG